MRPSYHFAVAPNCHITDFTILPPLPRLPIFPLCDFTVLPSWPFYRFPAFTILPLRHIAALPGCHFTIRPRRLTDFTISTSRTVLHLLTSFCHSTIFRLYHFTKMPLRRFTIFRYGRFLFPASFLSVSAVPGPGCPGDPVISPDIIFIGAHNPLV